jgi:hypothetical protein
MYEDAPGRRLIRVPPTRTRADVGRRSGGCSWRGSRPRLAGIRRGRARQTAAQQHHRHGDARADGEPGGQVQGDQPADDHAQAQQFAIAPDVELRKRRRGRHRVGTPAGPGALERPSPITPTTHIAGDAADIAGVAELYSVTPRAALSGPARVEVGLPVSCPRRHRPCCGRRTGMGSRGTPAGPAEVQRPQRSAATGPGRVPGASPRRPGDGGSLWASRGRGSDQGVLRVWAAMTPWASATR